MRYWWVNQKHTHRQEIGGDFLWSPKTKRNKKTKKPIANKSYEFMAQVRAGDVVFGYWGLRIRAIGVARGRAVTALRPSDFKKDRGDWADEGWRVPVEFSVLDVPIDPKDHAELLRRHLPKERGAYSPLHPKTLAGQRFLCLTELPVPIAEVLLAQAREADSLRKAAGLASSSSNSPEVAAAEAAADEAAGRSGGGQGTRQSAAERLAIEQHAMAVAKRFLESERGGKWAVIDVSVGNPYDLACRRGRETLHVEVKGTSLRVKSWC